MDLKFKEGVLFSVIGLWRHCWNVALVGNNNALIPPGTMTIRRLGTKPMPIERDNKTAGVEASPPMNKE